ncbi:MAG: VOC family protein [Sciscionella sp.]
MSVNILTHLNFAGNAREALEYYQSVFGGQLSIGTYGESGVPHDATSSEQAAFDPVPADSPDADHVSFGLLVADNGVRLAAYDVFGATDGAGLASSGLSGLRRADSLTHTEPFFVVLNADTRDDIAPLWDRLAAGGTVIQTLAPSAWSPAYGMLTDRYGVTWIFGAMS